MSNLFFEHKKNENLLPHSGLAFYHGRIFSNNEATALFKSLQTTITWRHDEGILFGKPYVTQRQVAWYGDAPFAYNYSQSAKKALPWTAELLQIKEHIEKVSQEKYNSCLLNLYNSGAEGMGWHADNEKELEAGAAIASLSLGAERRFVFKHRNSKEKRELLLEHGSLLVMAGATQEHWLHSMPKALRVKAGRINLTFRSMREGLRLVDNFPDGVGICVDKQPKVGC